MKIVIKIMKKVKTLKEKFHKTVSLDLSSTLLFSNIHFAYTIDPRGNKHKDRFHRVKRFNELNKLNEADIYAKL